MLSEPTFLDGAILHSLHSNICQQLAYFITRLLLPINALKEGH